MQRFRSAIIFAALSVFVALTACRSAGQREHNAALDQEQSVAHLFAGQIGKKLPGTAPVLVVIHPDPGPRLQEAQSRRVKGFRDALGESRVIEVPAAPPGDPRLAWVENDVLPMELFREILNVHPEAAALISLVGFPQEELRESLPFPVCLFGLAHQDLAWQAMDQGWSDAVLYFRGPGDHPPRQAAPIPPELLASWMMEIR